MEILRPVREEIGPRAGRAAIVMSPMMATWDAGSFCAPLTSLLVERGYRVTVYDTMSVARHCEDLPQAADRWGTILSDSHPAGIELVVGQAYGGALVQYMLRTALSSCPRFLGISAPTYCDETLRLALGSILHQFGESAEDALQMLEWHVLANDDETVPPRAERAPLEAAPRLTAGLSHLLSADARDKVASYAGNAMWLYGQRSRLVRAPNIVPALRNENQRAIGLACGMRPLHETRAESMDLIDMFLRETLT